MSEGKRTRVSNEQVLNAILALTDSVLKLANNTANPSPKETPKPEPVREMVANLSTAPSEPEMKAVCAKYGLNPEAVKGTLTKFNRWCSTKGAASGQYKVHVLVNSHGGKSLRWFQNAPKNSVGIIAQSV